MIPDPKKGKKLQIRLSSTTGYPDEINENKIS
jgi:hypothetical protein